AAVIDPYRLLLFRLEGSEIGGGDEAPGSLETRREPPCQAAAVEGSGAVGRDLFERAGEVGLHDRGAEWRRRAICKEKPRARRIGQQRRAVFFGEMAIAARRAEAVAREGDCLLEQVTPRQAAKALMHLIERGERARDRNRERPRARDGVRIALGRRRGRGGAGAVEHDRAAAGLFVNLVKTVAAETRHHRFDNTQRYRRRDRPIDRAAAGAQRQEPGLRG